MVQFVLGTHHFDKAPSFQSIALCVFHTIQEHGVTPVLEIYPQPHQYGYLR